MIPRIIHQSWKVKQIPDRWTAFQKSWRDHHPDYEYRFWTDEDNRALVAEHFPDLLSLYDGYQLPINRADLVRYLVVCRYGGIYADLDAEALRPLDGLLEGKSLIFGLEPESHLSRPAVQARRFTRLVGNAIFASVPRHPFWEHLIPMLIVAKDGPTVLDVAGPFVLTRACDSYPDQDAISIVPASLLHPIDNSGEQAKDEVASGAGEPPYAVHHWAGTWWREAVLSNARQRILAARGAKETTSAS